MDIHPKCKERLIELLSSVIPEFEVSSKTFLNRRSLERLSELDAALPNNQDFLDITFQYIGENPVSKFITERLYQLLNAKCEFDSEVNCKLIDLDYFNNPNELAEKLINEFESLPWPYSFFVKLPYNLGRQIISSLEENPFQISDNLSLIQADQNLTENFPPPPKHSSKKDFINLNLREEQNSWNYDFLYIKFEISGFVGYYDQTTPTHKFIDLVKSFLGLAIAQRTIAFEGNHYGSIFETKILVFQNSNESDWVSKKTHTFSESFSNEYEKLNIWNELIEKYNEQQVQGIIRSELNSIKKVFENIDTNEPLLKSSQWLFDSYCSENRLLSFIQLITSIEILLGDKKISDIIGLGELLRNRCAYLIGKTNKERDEILNDFKRIYDTRSQIVHRGKSRLSENEIEDFYKLRWFCLRTLQEEIELLKSDN